MKIIRWIQNVAAAAAFIVALNLVDGLGVSIKDACTAGVLLVLSVAMLLGRALEEEERGLSDEVSIYDPCRCATKDAVCIQKNRW